MTFATSRVAGFVAAIIAAGLGLLLIANANQASAGADGNPRCENRKATVNGLTGTNGNDVIVGTVNDDEIDGGGGKDIICGRDGDDEIQAGSGNDRVRGGVGDDLLNGEDGDDHLFGNGGDDGPTQGGRRLDFIGLVGGEGDDVMGGGNGDDQLAGQAGTDTHKGATGFDGCFDEEPDSTFKSCEYGSSPPRHGGGPGPRCDGKKATVNGTTGTPGNDVIVGTNGDDDIDGEGGKDVICGRSGDDEILGGTEDDRIRGGTGEDFLNGEEGDDKIYGNGGDDGPDNDKRGLKAVGLVGGEGDDLLGGGNGDDQLAGQGGQDDHFGATGFDGCFDEEPDSTFNSCEYGSGGGTR